MSRGPGTYRMTLVRSDEVPLYRQIYEHIRTTISVGQLPPGGRLPSARRLAEDFAMGRGTVDAAYAMLTGEGYVIARGPAGTIVSPNLRPLAIAKAARTRRPTSARIVVPAGQDHFRWACRRSMHFRATSGLVWSRARRACCQPPTWSTPTPQAFGHCGRRSRRTSRPLAVLPVPNAGDHHPGVSGGSWPGDRPLTHARRQGL